MSTQFDTTNQQAPYQQAPYQQAPYQQAPYQQALVSRAAGPGPASGSRSSARSRRRPWSRWP